MNINVSVYTIASLMGFRYECPQAKLAPGKGMVVMMMESRQGLAPAFVCFSEAPGIASVDTAGL